MHKSAQGCTGHAAERHPWDTDVGGGDGRSLRKKKRQAHKTSLTILTVGDQFFSLFRHRLKKVSENIETSFFTE
jgi:hypothetical protein